MRRFFTLCRYQIWQMAISPSTYIAAFLFLCFMGLIFLKSISDVSMYESSESPFEMFIWAFWIPVLFMVPLLTMRSLAEERRMGTLGALMTTSVTSAQVVMSKFVACYFFYMFIWLLTLFFPLITCWYVPSAKPLFDVWQMVTGYIFIFISGAMYIAIGIFASSLTRTTLVAGMLSFSMLFVVVVGAGIVAKFPILEQSGLSWVVDSAAYMQTFRHLEEFSGSMLDTRPFFFYFSTSAVLLAITALITESKNA